MQQHFKFKNGQWESCEAQVEWAEGKLRPLGWLEPGQFGFNSLIPAHHHLGWENGFYVQVFSGCNLRNESQFAYVVSLAVNEESHFFYVQNVLALIRLLGELAPICHAELATVDSEERDMREQEISRNKALKRKFAVE